MGKRDLRTMLQIVVVVLIVYGLSRTEGPGQLAFGVVVTFVVLVRLVIEIVRRLF